jgi:uncharacterized protein
MGLQPLPELDEANTPFWTGGAAGELRINRCQVCRRWFHPPAPVCPACLSTDIAAEPTSGRAVVAAYTVNHQAWAPDLEVPYVVAIVEIVEQPDVRLMTRIVDSQPGDVRIGLDVEVVFENFEDVWLPMFRPVAS